MKLDRVHYIDECNKRWGGVALTDARKNWSSFEELKETLIGALREYRRDPMQETVHGTFLNPDGTLTAFLWKLQSAITPDKSCLYPLLDFEEHFQKVFLRRGLIIYCSMILYELETINLPASNEPVLALTFEE